MFCGSLEDKNVESSADGGGMACDAPEGSLKTISAICYLELRFEILSFWSAGAGESVIINKREATLK